MNLFNEEKLEGIKFKGEIKISTQIKIAYVPQEIKFSFYGSVEEYLNLQSSELYKIFKRYNELKNKPLLSEEEIKEKLELAEKMTYFDLWGYEERRKIILEKLLLSPEILKKNIQEISGGEATKIALNGVFLSPANFWLLDEPTNNLDYPSLNLLLEEINKFKGGVIIVTHDRRILNALSKIIEIDEETKELRIYGGNYEFYRKKKQEEYEARLRDYKDQERRRKRLEEAIKELKQEAKEFEKISKDAFRRAKGAKLAKRAKAQEKRIIKELEKLKKPEIPEKPRFPLPKISPVKGTIFNLKDVSFIINNKKLFEITIKIEAGDRVLIEGANGTGKTTLLRILIGEISGASGTISRKDNLKIGYLPQSPAINDPNKTIKDFLKDIYHLREEEIKKIVNLMKIPHIINLKLKDLSLGEIRRIQLASILYQNPEVLILDEPTNHLDVYTIEDLEYALKAYQGTLIFTSHDDWFIKNLNCNKRIKLGVD